MRTLVISDVHGNLAALEAVLAEPHEAVICLGDVVGYGPQPAACLHLLQRTHARMIQGNHDHAVAEGVDPRCNPAFRWLADAVAPVTRAQLTEDDLACLGSLPHWMSVAIDGVEVLCVHATPRDPLYQYLGPDREAWIHEAAQGRVDRLLVGHTHLQFAIDLGRRRVVNPGSVGQPKDGDPRAAYAVMDGDSILLKRVSYSVQRTIAALRAADIPEAAVEQLAALLETGKVPRNLRKAG